ncbi:MAG TPA: sulfite exporter TauE/SafE family protein [Tepidisphaeraceae bacterium]|jgi:hypothetical protein|nr:sulfite exporter TauE/SafE family protein [Tepidisphaeraceae bacterium]
MTLGLLLVCIAAAMIGITKSGFGSGLGLIVVPIMALALATKDVAGLGPEATLGLMLPLLIVGDIIALTQQRKHVSLILVRKLLPATIVGVAVGGWFLYLAHQHKALAAALINLDIGFESILLVSLHWYRQLTSDRETVYVPKPWHNHLTGAFAGISSTLAHGAGPIIALYLLPQKPPRQTFVGTCAVYFFLLNTIKLSAYVLAGQFTAAPLSMTVRFVPLVLLGGAIGYLLNRRISDRLFSNIVYIGTFVLGWYLLYLGLRDIYAYRYGT